MSYITNETERLEAKRVVNEYVDSLTRIAAEKDLQKELKNQLKEKFNIPPAHTSKVAKMLLKRNLTEETEAFTVQEELYTQLSR